MADEAQDALDIIRNRLQTILLRSELCENPRKCDTCASAVCEIIKEIRTLETFVRSVSAKNK